VGRGSEVPPPAGKGGKNGFGYNSFNDPRKGEEERLSSLSENPPTKTACRPQTPRGKRGRNTGCSAFTCTALKGKGKAVERDPRICQKKSNIFVWGGGDIPPELVVVNRKETALPLRIRLRGGEGNAERVHRIEGGKGGPTLPLLLIFEKMGKQGLVFRGEKKKGTTPFFEKREEDQIPSLPVSFRKEEGLALNPYIEEINREGKAITNTTSRGGEVLGLGRIVVEGKKSRLIYPRSKAAGRTNGKDGRIDLEERGRPPNVLRL